MLSSPSTRPWAVARSLSATDLADRSLPAGLAHLDGGAPAEPWARGSPGRVAPPPPTSVLRLDCGATVPSGVPAEPLARGSSGRARPHVAAEPVTASSPGVAVAWGCMEENVRLRRELASLRGCLAGSRTLQAEDSWSWRDAGGPEGLLEEQAAAPRPSAPEAQEAALRALDELAELVARVHPARLRRDARDYPVLGAGGGARGAASELDAPERCWLEGGGARGQLRGHVAQVLDWAAATVDCGREGYFHLDLRCRSAGAGALVRALGRISSRSSGWALRRLSAAAAASRAARKESSRRRGPELLLQRLRGAAGRAGERRVLELAAACFRRWRERSEDGAAWIRRRSPFVEHRWRSALGRLARQAWTAWAEAWRAAARESLERAWTEELETTRRQLLEEAASQARELEGAVQEFRVRAADADQELEAARREFRASAAAQEQELEVRRELHASAAAQVQELEAARRELRARAATQAHKFIVVSLSGTVRAPFSAWLRAAQEAREKRAACAALAFAPQRWLLEQIVMRCFTELWGGPRCARSLCTLAVGTGASQSTMSALDPATIHRFVGPQSCWQVSYTFQRCCSPIHGPAGNSECWFAGSAVGGYSYAYCCKWPRVRWTRPDSSYHDLSAFSLSATVDRLLPQVSALAGAAGSGSPGFETPLGKAPVFLLTYLKTGVYISWPSKTRCVQS
ncbi:unnamed protein product [Prorocentrum cordatum]|uniref:Uncharacterized protein n=1 Tax=Prorocentrum cordatum TaxID=2364126 RepID=A0ABN9V3S6_9DINO|nr:unnamed protein product [Polarella glacialis]